MFTAARINGTATYGHAARTTPGVVGRVPRPVVRPGEHFASPYLDRRGGPAGAGLILSSSEISAVPLVTPRSPFQQGEDVYIKLPAGATGAVGEKLFTFTLGEDSERYGQLVIPTGILVVVRAGGPGEATTARVLEQFEEMDNRQGVLPLDTPSFPAPGSMPAAVEDGFKSHVVYIDDRVVLPSLAFYVVVPATDHDAAKLGDLITLYRPASVDYQTGIKLPEQAIATAQVVRVTGRSVTAAITAYSNPDIKIGTAARLTARIP